MLGCVTQVKLRHMHMDRVRLGDDNCFFVSDAKINQLTQSITKAVSEADSILNFHSKTETLFLCKKIQNILCSLPGFKRNKS